MKQLLEDSLILLKDVRKVNIADAHHNVDIECLEYADLGIDDMATATMEDSDDDKSDEESDVGEESDADSSDNEEYMGSFK